MFELWVALALIALVVSGSALGLALALRARLQRMLEHEAVLEKRLQAVQEQSRIDLLAMGQRIIDIEKQLRRASDRLETLEAARSPADRYGQLDARLTTRRAPDEQSESSAEAQLRSMLQQRGKRGDDLS